MQCRDLYFNRMYSKQLSYMASVMDGYLWKHRMSTSNLSEDGCHQTCNAATLIQHAAKFPWIVNIKSSIKQNDNEIYFSEINLLHVEMYHYRRLLTDTETILDSIDSLQAATQGNERYFERLKNLFIDDNYEIFLE